MTGMKAEVCSVRVAEQILGVFKAPGGWTFLPHQTFVKRAFPCVPTPPSHFRQLTLFFLFVKIPSCIASPPKHSSKQPPCTAISRAMERRPVAMAPQHPRSFARQLRGDLTPGYPGTGPLAGGDTSGSLGLHLHGVPAASAHLLALPVA